MAIAQDADDAIAALMREALANGVFTGAAWAVGTTGASAQGACGRLTEGAGATPVTVDTPFDIASLTKIVSTWALVGTLVAQQRLAPGATLAQLLPGRVGAELAPVTILQLLTHTAGLPLRAQLRALYGEDRAAIRRGVLHAALFRAPGSAVEYTDRAALILGFVIEHVLAMPLAQAAETLVWRPMGMRATGYGLPPALAATAAATEVFEETGVRWQGIVHDYSARLLGDSCGSAGVFSNTADLAIFMRQLLRMLDADDGAEGRFGADWLRASLKVQTGALTPARGLFWHPAAGTEPEDDVWCHHGFTGTSLFICPQQRRYGVLLTNKVYFTRETEAINGLRRAFLRAVFCVGIQ
jgi:CubicO group peptidase (beta-lactamase class C family)